MMGTLLLIVGLILTACGMFVSYVIQNNFADNKWERVFYVWLISWLYFMGLFLIFYPMGMKEGEIDQMKGTPSWEMKVLYEIDENGETIPSDTLYVKIETE